MFGGGFHNLLDEQGESNNKWNKIPKKNKQTKAKNKQANKPQPKIQKRTSLTILNVKIVLLTFCNQNPRMLIPDATWKFNVPQKLLAKEPESEIHFALTKNQRLYAKVEI